MINVRLVWFLESNNLITNFQCGFRKQRSTIDHLVRLETFIRDAHIKKHHLVAVFFDLEKAYDTTWKYGIMKDLKELGLVGRLPTFISDFLSDRNFKVRVGTTLSDTQEQEEGVPQGSILSVTLFGIKINNIVKCLNPGVDCSLYVDDFIICYRAKNMFTIERQLQQCINKLQTWTTNNGFKFSKTKTQCVHFCRERRCHIDPVLKLGDAQIPVVDEAKFLGVIFDKNLTFEPHIKALKTKCMKSLNLLKHLAHTDWGADRTVLLHLYRSLIRSKLDYGCIVYGSAKKEHLQRLDAVHHQGLRLALGAFRTSPINSLLVEADEPSLSLRREKLALNYITKLKANPSNPAYEAVFDPMYETLYNRKDRAPKPIGLRLRDAITEADLQLNSVSEQKCPNVPPWTIKQPKVLFNLCKGKKSDTLPEKFRLDFCELKSYYRDFTEVYTDGSKDNNKVGCASVSEFHTFKMRLPDGASIFTAEAQAIDLTLKFISDFHQKNYIIFSDSLSVLQSLQNKDLSNPIIQKVLIKHSNLSTSKNIIFCWLPSHVGIRGNEEADREAKAALNVDIAKLKLPFSDFRPRVAKHIVSKWQEKWDECRGNKLHSIRPIVGERKPVHRSIRREEVVLTRCRIGHSRFTHGFLLRKEVQPECVFCVEPLTIEHILLKCADLIFIRQNYFQCNSMEELFQTVSNDTILEFLKETGIYTKI